MINAFRNSGRIVLGLAVAFALSLASHASAAETGKVTGKVLDKDGKGVAGAQVALRPPPDKGNAPAAAPAAAQDEGKKKQGKPIAKTTSEADGSFTLADVPVGDYLLAANAKEHGMAREKVSVKAGETVTVNLTLKMGKGGGKKKKGE